MTDNVKRTTKKPQTLFSAPTMQELLPTKSISTDCISPQNTCSEKQANIDTLRKRKERLK